jgi:predicted nucleic acid-binding protein
VLALARKYTIDLSDAFQILSVKEGFYSPLIGVILVTADQRLAAAARSESIKVRVYDGNKWLAP